MKILWLYAVLALAVSLRIYGQSPAGTSVRIEVWRGCLCEGPLHARTYGQLDAERTKRMEFGRSVSLSADDIKISAVGYLKKLFGEERFGRDFRFHWKGVVYRKKEDGGGYEVSFRGALSRYSMGDAKDGDLILFYSEMY